MNLQSYFITSPALYPNNSIFIFTQNLQNISSMHHIDKACFRDNSAIIPDHLIEIFIRWCEKNQIQSFINLVNTQSSIKYAKLYDAKGVHIKENSLYDTKKAQNEKLLIFYSSHCIKQAQEALKIGVDFLTLSPIFHTPNKGIPLGIQYLKMIDSSIKSRLFALGGIICENQITQIKTTGVKGFASIRYFQDTQILKTNNNVLE
ncbi:hypothetical protein BKH42_01555 [Helicobacter sp. 13S00482-2]|uniref:thiamine phosphate synthase n=1 Tax=Helicobacter sp. 13S00482-2 TaxID=1476200 RepID=UPI000BA7520B|nr:thiamine phosphate synthase [Helicobacter sp. 13S00482-2]PAF54220.1 hypothetical protein BKH42_01555 [Helicobacter sp. 13S00482-2]